MNIYFLDTFRCCPCICEGHLASYQIKVISNPIAKAKTIHNIMSKEEIESTESLSNNIVATISIVSSASGNTSTTMEHQGSNYK
jgi:hypothetical protein